MLGFIKKGAKFVLKLPVYFYKGCISPLLPHSCRFYPTCSNYMIESINAFGLKGVIIGLKRIAKCNPCNKNCGYDPVPINIKGEVKWLF